MRISDSYHLSGTLPGAELLAAAYEGNPLLFGGVACRRAALQGCDRLRAEEGASPSHLSGISPLIQQQPLNLIFQPFFPPRALCSVFSCGMCCWSASLIVKKKKNLTSVTCFPSFYFYSSPQAELTRDRFGLLSRKETGFKSLRSRAKRTV